MARSIRRTAFSLVEVLIAIGIFAILLALSLTAVQRIRAHAVQMQSKNKLKQIALATNNYASANSGSLPGFHTFTMTSGSLGTFVPLLPYLEQDNGIVPKPSQPEFTWVPAFVSPADLSFRKPLIRLDSSGSSRMSAGSHSYPANWQALRLDVTLTTSFPDGISNTIAFAERYSRCSEVDVWWYETSTGCLDLQNNTIIPCTSPSTPDLRRPTFADPDYDDVLPVTANGVTRPSVAGQTFQTVPTIEQCDYRVPQTPHASGMLTAYLDGSVRTIRPGIAPEVFWGLVTPAGGEVSTDSW